VKLLDTVPDTVPNRTGRVLFVLVTRDTLDEGAGGTDTLGVFLSVDDATRYCKDVTYRGDEYGQRVCMYRDCHVLRLEPEPHEQ
jgi:hypothetical protein